MKYKAIIFDIDGTAVPITGMRPSARLKRAVKAAQTSAKLAAATGRGIELARPVLQNLELISPCIIMGGTAIIDPISGDSLWEKTMSVSQISQALKVSKPYITEDNVFIGVSTTNPPIPLQDFEVYEQRACVAFVLGLKQAQAEQLSRKIRAYDGLIAHGTPGWWGSDLTDIHITQREATKEQSAKALIKLLNLKPEEVIGVGDSANDLPIFEAVGYRVAMGNGSASVKRVADEIAPPVDEDGLAQIIEKYFL